MTQTEKDLLKDLYENGPKSFDIARSSLRLLMDGWGLKNLGYAKIANELIYLTEIGLVKAESDLDVF